MNFTTVDAVIVIAYLGGIAAFGIFSGGRQQSARDYFLSESAVPWWAVCLAIVATETSALTFLSIPGIAYIGNLNFLQIAIGYLLGRILVATLLLPRYFSGDTGTAYTFLRQRFGNGMRASASITFMGTRLFADGVRLYTTAIPLALLLSGTRLLGGVSDQSFYLLTIAGLAALTLVYVFLGGVRAVIWTDVVQLLLYTVGAVAALSVLLSFPGSGWDALAQPALAEKLVVFAWHPGEASFFSTPYTTLASLLGGAFLSMASHGADQLIVQRVLATRRIDAARKAMIWSGVVVLLQFALFLVIGVLLYAHMGEGLPANEVFARFILQDLPSGLTGLIVAAILAAAMSTLSGSISALSSSTLMDIIEPLRRIPLEPRDALRLSRMISIGWCLLLVAAASLFIQTPSTVVELALSIASYTYGGLLGVFLLGILSTRPRERDAMIGFFTGIAVMTAVILFSGIAWTWYTLIGSSATLVTGWSVSLRHRKETDRT